MEVNGKMDTKKFMTDTIVFVGLVSLDGVYFTVGCLSVPY